MTKYILRLYILGNTKGSEKTLTNLKTLLDDELSNQYSLEIIDLLQNPQLAEEDKIFATPTVVKVLPGPIRKVVGDLANKQKVLVGLDLARID